MTSRRCDSSTRLGRAGAPARAGRRLTATFIDMVFFSLLSGLLALPLILRLPPQQPDQTVVDILATLASDRPWLHLAAALLAAWVALWWAYFIIGWGWLGATPGQWILGLRVIDHRGRCPIGPSRAALRLIAYCVSSIPFFAGHLLVLLRSDSRSLHDMLAGTRIIRIRGEGRPRRSRTPHDGEPLDGGFEQ